ncbi:hypothetical protein BH11PSE13_BH11PSE13_02430 [soil metagenome]
MSSPSSSAVSHGLPGDFVTSDFDALALHMRECARGRGPMFSIQGGLQRIHSMAASRIITVAFVAFVMGLGLMALA